MNELRYQEYRNKRLEEIAAQEKALKDFLEQHKEEIAKAQEEIEAEYALKQAREQAEREQAEFYARFEREQNIQFIISKMNDASSIEELKRISLFYSHGNELKYTPEVFPVYEKNFIRLASVPVPSSASDEKAKKIIFAVAVVIGIATIVTKIFF